MGENAICGLPGNVGRTNLVSKQVKFLRANVDSTTLDSLRTKLVLEPDSIRDYAVSSRLEEDTGFSRLHRVSETIQGR